MTLYVYPLCLCPDTSLTTEVFHVKAGDNGTEVDL